MIEDNGMRVKECMQESGKTKFSIKGMLSSSPLDDRTSQNSDQNQTSLLDVC